VPNKHHLHGNLKKVRDANENGLELDYNNTEGGYEMIMSV